MAWDGTERRKLPMHCQDEVLQKLTDIDVEVRLMRPILTRLQVLLEGSNGRPGLVIRHDRVECITNVLCWALGVIYIAVVGVLAKQWLG